MRPSPVHILLIGEQNDTSAWVHECLRDYGRYLVIDERVSRERTPGNGARRTPVDLILVACHHDPAAGVAHLRTLRGQGIGAPALVLSPSAAENLDMDITSIGETHFLNEATVSATELEDMIRRLVDRTSTPPARFLNAAMNSLSAQIAVLDAGGVIIEVNDAWRRRDEGNDLCSPTLDVGTNYLEICDGLSGENAVIARELADGLRALLKGDRDHVYVEYSYLHGREQRWCIARATVLAGESSRHVVVMHESITDLKKAERRIGDIVDGLQVIIWESDAFTDRFSYVNQTAECMLGYARERWTNEPGFWSSILHPVDRDRVKTYCRTHMSNGLDHELEYRVIAEDGRVVWIRDIVFVSTDADGSPLRMRGMMLDITARKEAEAIRRESEGRYQAIFEHSPVGIVTLDRDSHILAANPAFLNMTGFSLEELRTLPYTSRWPDSTKETSQRLFSELVEGLREHYTIEKSFLHRDGHVVHVRMSISAVRDEDGRFVHSVSIVEDTTESQRAEEALRQSEHRFRSLVQNSTDITTIIARDGTILYKSPSIQSILGYDPDDFAGVNAFDLIHPDDVDRVRVEFNRALQTPQARSVFSYRIQNADGTWTWLESTGRDLTSDKVVGGIVVNSRDITERKRFEDLQQMLSNASAALGASLDYEMTLQQVARIAVPTFADWCVVSMLDTDGQLRRLAVVHADPAKQPLADELKGHPPSDPDSPYGVPYVMRTGQVVLNTAFPDGHWDKEEWETKRDILPKLGTTSSLVAPMTVNGVTVGAIAFQYGDSGRQYVESDVPYAEEIARRAAIAIENARLHREVSAAETRFRSLVQHASDMIAIIDENMVIRYESPAIQQALGYLPDELVGMHAADGIHPDELSGIQAFFQTVLASPGIHMPVTYRFRHKNGEWRWIDATVTNLLDEPSIRGVVVNARDVTDRREAEEIIRQSEALFRSAFDDASVGMAILDMDRRLTAVNPALCHMLGYQASELIGKMGVDISHPDDLDIVTQERQKLLDGAQQSFQVEKRYFHRDGSTIWCLLNSAVVRDANGNPTYILSQFQDITTRKLLETQLSHQALHDTLTGLPNRTLLLDRLDRAISSSRRFGGMVGVLFLDLDNFKLINDSLGHSAGDVLLIRVAQRLLGCVRDDDTIARFGGDEFAIVMGHLSDGAEALEIAQRVSESLAKPLPIGGRDVIMTTSIGIALGRNGEFNRNELLRQADIAMYRAKSTGKASYRLFDSAMHDAALHRLELEHDLRRAVEREEFVLYFQPVVSLTTRQVSGLEALVRWRHPVKGLVSPAAFIPIAEETGLIVQIGDWVLHEASRHLARWRTSGVVPDSLRISVNLSARQFRQPELVEQVKSALESSGLPAHQLILELTESNVMANPEEAVERLQALREIGVHIAIDDFGTGYSSLAYLHSFPVEILKIDRSFISSMGGERDSSSLVAAIVRLAHALGLSIVGEGVETEQQAEMLLGFACDSAQGFLFSAPVSGSDVPALFNANVVAHAG